MPAEGVTLSGVRKDGDCKLTELWRIPPRAGAEGAKRKTLISQAKGQSLFFTFSLFVLYGLRFRNPFLFFIFI